MMFPACVTKSKTSNRAISSFLGPWYNAYTKFRKYRPTHSMIERAIDMILVLWGRLSLTKEGEWGKGSL
jgi:hypothetical protein